MPKTIVITGSTRGIGRGLALEFLRQGHQVCLNGTTDKSLQSIENELQSYPGQWAYLAGDVSDPSLHEKLFQKAVKTFGKVDIWVNNAGVNQPQAMVQDLDSAAIEKVLAVNIGGVIHGSRIAYREMVKQGYGRIFNMEGLGSNGMIIPGTIVYSTSKRAVNYFTKAFSRERQYTGVSIGIISPGMVVTDFLRQAEDDSVASKKKIKMFNILADRVEPVAAFLVKGMLKSNKNYDRIE